VYAKEDQDSDFPALTIYHDFDEIQEGDEVLAIAQDEFALGKFIEMCEQMIVQNVKNLLFGDEDGAGASSNWH